MSKLRRSPCNLHIQRLLPLNLCSFLFSHLQALGPIDYMGTMQSMTPQKASVLGSLLDDVARSDLDVLERVLCCPLSTSAIPSIAIWIAETCVDVQSTVSH